MNSSMSASDSVPSAKNFTVAANERKKTNASVVSAMRRARSKEMNRQMVAGGRMDQSLACA